MSVPLNNQNAKKCGLSDKRKKFCQELLNVNFNAKQAAINAGYSKKTAENQASRLLTNVKVQEYLSYLKNKALEKIEITHEDLLNQWKKIAFNDISQVYDNWMTLKDFDQLKKDNPDIMFCIKSISTKVEKRKSPGENAVKCKVEYIKIEWKDSLEALKNIGQHIGFYEKDNSQKSLKIPIITSLTETGKKEIDKLING